MSILLCISATTEDATRLAENGPRRDFIELARATGGEVLYRAERPRHRGLLGRLFGPHIRQAWVAAGRSGRGDTVFADGEHIGIPLCFFLVARRRFGVRVVMLGHLVDRSWKRAPMAALSRIGPATVLIVHSVNQAQEVGGTLGVRWRLELMPYQVDTEFWRAEAAPRTETPVFLAVGSEQRDYDTLAEAVRGLPVRVRIAAGSHWARRTATTAGLPENVEYVERPLPFAALREAYEAAIAVVVPLANVSNQSGVTTILEAMSMSRAVITTANPGQRECVVGPLIRSAEHGQAPCDVFRGPALFGYPHRQGAQTGFYTPVGDVAALRKAILLLLNDQQLRQRLGDNGRSTACSSFGIEAFTERLAGLLNPATSTSQPAMAVER